MTKERKKEIPNRIASITKARKEAIPMLIPPILHPSRTEHSGTTSRSRQDRKHMKGKACGTLYHRCTQDRPAEHQNHFPNHLYIISQNKLPHLPLINDDALMMYFSPQRPMYVHRIRYEMRRRTRYTPLPIHRLLASLLYYPSDRTQCPNKVGWLGCIMFMMRKFDCLGRQRVSSVRAPSLSEFWQCVRQESTGYWLLAVGAISSTRRRSSRVSG